MIVEIWLHLQGGMLQLIISLCIMVWWCKLTFEPFTTLSAHSSIRVGNLHDSTKIDI
jgi:hypothetical protein